MNNFSCILHMRRKIIILHAQLWKCGKGSKRKKYVRELIPKCKDLTQVLTKSDFRTVRLTIQKVVLKCFSSSVVSLVS